VGNGMDSKFCLKNGSTYLPDPTLPMMNLVTAIIGGFPNIKVEMNLSKLFSPQGMAGKG
jgi:hypothetical protein